MSYIDKALMDNEQVVYRTRPHWIIFAPAIFWLVAVILVALIGPNYEIGRFAIPNTTYTLTYLTGMLFLIFALFTASSTAVYYISTAFVITNQRVVLKVGFIRRDTLEILLHRVESIQLRQSILGRIINYGTIIVSGTGGSKDPMCTIPTPLAFRNCVQAQIEGLPSRKKA